MERIVSARDLSAYLAERFRRDGFVGPGVKVEKGELILPIGPELERFCNVAAALRQRCDKAATLSRHDSDNVAAFADKRNCTTDDWQDITENTLNAERKADRARERALK